MNALLIKLLNMSAAGSVMILAVVVLRALLKKAPRWIICAMWALVAIRLICPASIASPVSAFRATPFFVSESGEVELFRQVGVGEPMLAVDTVQIERPRTNAETIREIPGTPYAVTQRSHDTYLPPLVQAHLLGLTAMLLYAIVSTLLLRRKVSISLQQRGNIRVCDEVASPFILGILRPVIYLPSSLSEEEKRFVLAHERAHLRRLDHVWKPLGFLILSVHWFNPFCWLAYVLLCRDIELACDEKVIRELGRAERAAYSQTLLNCSAHRILAACPVAFGETDVKTRVKAVLNYKKPAFWIVLAAALSCIVLVACFATKPIQEPGRLPDQGLSPDNPAVEVPAPDIRQNIYNSLIGWLNVSAGIDPELAVPNMEQMDIQPFAEDDLPRNMFYENVTPTWFVGGLMKPATMLAPAYIVTAYFDHTGRIVGFASEEVEGSVPLYEADAQITGDSTPPPDPFGVTDYLPEYREVTDKYIRALSDEIDGTRLYEDGVSILVHNFYNQNPLQRLGYALVDLNQDGRPELIIGSVDNDAFYGNILFDVYRLFPALGHYGPPLKTVESMERDRWYYLNMGPDSASKFLLNEASGGASRGEWTLWKMDPNQVQLVFVQGFVKNESGWFTAKLVNGEMAADQPISEKEVAETKRFIDSFKVRFSFIPFETISAPSASLADLY